MKKLNQRIKVDTKLQIEDLQGWYTVSSIINDNFVQAVGMVGSFQSTHILKFRNRGNNHDIL